MGRPDMTNELLAALAKRGCPVCKVPKHFGCISRLTGRTMIHQIHRERTDSYVRAHTATALGKTRRKDRT